MTKKISVYGKDVFGKTYSFKVDPTKYPDEYLKYTNLTKVPDSGKTPEGTIKIRRNKASDYFFQIRLLLKNGKTIARFNGASGTGGFVGLIGKSIAGSVIEAILK